MLQARITKSLGSLFNWLIIYTSLVGAPDLFGSKRTACSPSQPRHRPAPGHTVTVPVGPDFALQLQCCWQSRKKWMIQPVFYPGGCQTLGCLCHLKDRSSCPEQALLHQWELCFGLWGSLGTEKTQGFSAEEILTFWVDFYGGFRETKINIHQSSPEKASHNPEYENMSRAACKMDLHTSELHIQPLHWASWSALKMVTLNYVAAANWMLEKHTQTYPELWHPFPLSYLDG